MKALAIKALVIATLTVPCAALAQGAPTGQQKSETMTDQQFVEKAAAGNLAEVQMGKMAQEKAQRPEVKQFGERMVQDHSRANEELQATAKKANITVPTEPASEARQKMQQFSQLSGEEFDREYSRFMVEDHQKDIATYQAAIQNAKEQDIKDYAQKTLPVLQEHLNLAQSMREQMAASPETKPQQSR